MPDNIPKPWEPGYSVDKLPTQPRAWGTAKPGDLRKDAYKNFRGRGMKDLSPEERALAKEKELATKKEKKKKLKSIGTRRISAKHFATAEEMMERHQFDPMNLLMDVAQGKALYDDHPFLPVLHQYIADMQERIEFEDGFGVRGLLEQLKVESWGYLKDSYTPKEHRIKVATELLQYVRPKKKQIEHTGEGNQGPREVVPLTQEEVQLFGEWFNENF